MALGDCVHNDETFHAKYQVEFVFHAFAVRTSRNLAYLLLQLHKECILETRIDPATLKQRLLEHESGYTPDAYRSILRILVRLRFFRTFHQHVRALLVQRKSEHTWDIHLVRTTTSPCLTLDSAFTQRSSYMYMLKNRKVWKTTLRKFLVNMISNRVGFACDVHEYTHERGTDNDNGEESDESEKSQEKKPHIAAVGAFVCLSTTSLDWTFGLDTLPEQFVYLRGSFDHDAVLVWHMVLLDDYLDFYQFPRMFSTDIQEYFKTYTLFYMKSRVLKCIPDVWHRSVPRKYKKRFKLST